MKYLIIFFFLLVFSCNNKKTSLPDCFVKGYTEAKIIKGTVYGYSPMDKDGHGSMESFFVGSECFSYSCFISTGFYNTPCFRGGIVCENGQKVKVTYKTRCHINSIIKIELID